MGDWYYLVFSSYTTLFGNYYVKCPVGGTEWQIPKNHRLDGRAFYAAKTAGHDFERYLFGWNPTKEEDERGVWQDRLHSVDHRTWDWGGSMVIHELHQQPDGDLMLSVPKKKKELFTCPVENVFTPVTDGWEMLDGGCRSTTGASQQMMFMQPVPEQCYFSAEIEIENAVQVGVVLQVEEQMKEGYYIYLEPENRRLVYRTGLRMSEDGGKTFPYDVEQETTIRIPEDGRYRLEILIEGSVACAYVNGEAALSFRMYDYTGRNFGLFSLGKAVFRNVSVKTIGE